MDAVRRAGLPRVVTSCPRVNFLRWVGGQWRAKKCENVVEVITQQLAA